MIPKPVEDLMRRSGVRYQRRTVPKDETATAQQTAHAAHVSGWMMAKTVLVRVDGQPTIAVMPASERVDLQRLKEELGARKIELLGEEEVARMCQPCEPGAVPPFGDLFGMPTIMDRHLAAEPHLMIPAGEHGELADVPVDDLSRAAHPRIAELGVLWP